MIISQIAMALIDITKQTKHRHYNKCATKPLLGNYIQWALTLIYTEIEKKHNKNS